jgi:hypothetical protein
MKRLLPPIALVALAALILSEVGLFAANERTVPTYPGFGYAARGDSMALEGLAFATMRPVALRPGRIRTEAPSNALAQNAVEPARWRRFAWNMEFVGRGLGQSPEGLEWSLTAVQRARAELRAARGRQSDP